MKSIGAVASLRELCLPRFTGITPEGMKHLGNSRNLERLDLRQGPVNDEGLRRLGKLKNLKELNLADTKITDAGLSHLAALTSLEQVDLDGTSVTDVGLGHLRGLKRLRDVFCKGTGVTRNGLIRLSKDVPALLPPDDPADVKTVRDLCHFSIKLDRDGNVAAIGVDGQDLRSSRSLGPALQSLTACSLAGNVTGVRMRSWRSSSRGPCSRTLGLTT